MALDLDEARVQRNEFALWLAWTLATALGMLAGYLPLALLVNSLDLGLARVLVPLLTGLLLGLAQWLVLRPYIAQSHDWILNHAAGWVAGYTLGLFVVQLLAKTTLGLLLGYVAFGAIVALFQYPALRREIPHLSIWLAANVLGWTLGAYLSQLAASLLFRGALPDTFASVLVSVGVTGLVAGALTALALIWIVRQPDQLDKLAAPR
jgi:hypothetical protein